MRDEQTLKIELLSQWKLEAEFRNNKFLQFHLVVVGLLLAPEFSSVLHILTIII